MKKLLMLFATTLIVTPVQSIAADKELTITNKRDLYPIMFVFITPAGHTTWGQDQLGGGTLAAGQSRTWAIPWGGCHVDVQAKTFTGLTAERRNVDICGGYEWTIYDESSKSATSQARPAGNASGTMTWNIRDSCNNREAIAVRFFSARADLSWPSNGYWYTQQHGGSHVQRLSCPAGRKVCYGAWQDGHNLTWGAGRLGTDYCPDCCHPCDGNEYQVALACG